MDNVPNNDTTEQQEVTHLSALYEITTLINFSSRVDEVLEKIIDQACQASDCLAASLMLIEDKTRELKLKAVKGEKAQAIKSLQSFLKFRVGQGIAGWVAERGQPLVINEPTKDERFNRDADTLLGFTTTNILCVPLILKNRIIGIIELMNKRSGSFTRADLEFLHTIAGLVAMSMENGRLFEELTQAKNYLNDTIDNMPGGFISIDLNNTITTFNFMAGKILLIHRCDSFGKNCRQAFIKQYQLANILVETLETKKVANRLEVNIRRGDGQEICLGYGTILIKDGVGNPVGAGIIFQDLTVIRGRC